MTIHTQLTIPELEASIKSVPSARDVHIEGSVVIYKFEDKDKDLMVISANEIDNERAVIVMITKVPKDKIITSLISGNMWNQRKDTHNTFAYVATADEDNISIVLESHLLLTGGVEDGHIRAWIENFNNHINLFESTVFQEILSGKTDDELQGSLGGLFRTFVTEVGIGIGTTLSEIFGLKEAASRDWP